MKPPRNRTAAATLAQMAGKDRTQVPTWFTAKSRDASPGTISSAPRQSKPERYARLGRAHITKTGTTAKVIWNMMNKQEQEEGKNAIIA